MASQKNTTETDAADEQSMEEILQSIRRIIAEEGDGAEANSVPETEDVLELTEIVDEPTAGSDEDPLATIDAIMAAAPPEIEVMPMPAIEPMPQPVRSQPAPETRTFEPRELPKSMPENPRTEPDQSALLSESTAAAAISSLRSVRDSAQRAADTKPHSLTFRSGTTVEDLILEALRPMLKEWLDAHLPQTVERIVQREIHRLASEVE